MSSHLSGRERFGSHDWGAHGRTNAIGTLFLGTLLTVSLFQTTINTDVFNSWIIDDFLPKLTSQSVVIMDNATFHKGKEMQAALEASRAHFALSAAPQSRFQSN